MKKVVLFFAVCASVALSSCGNTPAADNNAADTDEKQKQRVWFSESHPSFFARPVCNVLLTSDFPFQKSGNGVVGGISVPLTLIVMARP